MRHVPPARLRRDEENNVIGFLGMAFRLRDGETYLSAAWIEHHNTGAKQTDINATIQCFKAARSVKKNDRFAVGNVAVIKGICATASQSIRVVHDPIDGFACHASIRQLRTDDDGLLDLLAEEAWAEMHQ